MNMKGWVDKAMSHFEFYDDNSKKYIFEIIGNNVIYISKTEDHFPNLYYLIS